MAIAPSNRILLLTDNNRLSLSLKTSLGKFNLSIEEENINLASLDSIRRVIKATKNTTFLRTELMKFIRQHGYPFLIAIDYQIDTGLDPELDPDKMKIFRTLFISYIILMRGSEFEPLRGNFIMLAKDNQLKEAQALEKNPARFLDRLTTRDDKVNSFIDEFKTNNAKFMKHFFVKTIPAGGPSDQVIMLMDNYITAINARNTMELKQEAKPQTSAHDKNQREAANVLYRIDETQTYVDGTVTANPGEFMNLEPGRFYIQGYWTNTTQMEVSGKIAAAIRGNLNKLAAFTPDSDIIIMCGDDCVTDASTAASMAQMTGKDLVDYRKLQILVGTKNMKMLENATGFSLIQKFVKPISSTL